METFQRSLAVDPGGETTMAERWWWFSRYGWLVTDGWMEAFQRSPVAELKLEPWR